ncbi:MAG: sigma-70 family RNA polymerase sigma factor [Clostridia bacterium]|nr:sigma-70 family RNA polymerase sigma factor [Clostridia bacterium]MBR3324612.1 sigma-70 family RNA polymerase sigma factor [Clostridia bacterium]
MQMNENLKNKIQQAQKGNKNTLNEIVKENYGLIYSIARRFENRGYDMEEIQQIGAIGLVKAIQKFDFSYNVMLSTFAVTYIIGEIKRFLRDDGPVKVSRELKTLATKIDVEKKENPNITIKELSKKLSANEESIILAIESSSMPESLDGKIDDDRISLLDRISSKDNSEEKIVEKISLIDSIKKLNDKEKQLIYLRYYKGQTQQKIADIIGISQVQVSRLEKKALKTLRKDLEEA